MNRATSCYPHFSKAGRRLAGCCVLLCLLAALAAKAGAGDGEAAPAPTASAPVDTPKKSPEPVSGRPHEPERGATPRPGDSPQGARSRDERNLTAEVQRVRPGKFPQAVVVVKVKTLGTAGGPQGVAPGDELSLIPQYRIERGQVIMTDPDTLINAGSFYLLPSDRVAVRLGERHDLTWDATYIERF